MLLKLVTAFAAVTATASADPILLQDMPGHITQASITVDASPAEVYALFTDYAKWPLFLSDLRGMRVENADREHGLVQFHSASLDHLVTVQFTNVPNRELRFKGVKGPTGGRAAGTYRLEPLDGGQRTKVTAALYLDVVGPSSIFISDSKIRRMRHAKLRVDLSDVLRAFPHREIRQPSA